MQYQHTVLDTLVYLFDYLVYEKKTRPSVDEMHEELGAAGFEKKDIERAMSWLLDLNDLQEANVFNAPSAQSVRQFTPAESAKLSVEARGFICEMTRLGVIDTRLREILIQKMMTLDEEQLSIDEVKWIALMAVYNREGQEANSVWLEQSLLEDHCLPSVH